MAANKLPESPDEGKQCAFSGDLRFCWAAFLGASV